MLSHDVPRPLIELLYLRASSGHDGEGAVPALLDPPTSQATAPIALAEWEVLWERSLNAIGSTPSEHIPFWRDAIVAAGLNVDSLRNWIIAVTRSVTAELIGPDARESLKLEERLFATVRGVVPTIGVIPVDDTYLKRASPQLIVVSLELRRNVDTYAELLSRELA